MIDRNVLSQALGLPEEITQELIDLFTEFAKDQLPILKKACHTQDRTLLSETAHALKGSALNINLEPIVVAARNLEKGAAEKSWPELQQASQQLIELIDQELN